jgi:hypothetical protein
MAAATVIGATDDEGDEREVAGVREADADPVGDDAPVDGGVPADVGVVPPPSPVQPAVRPTSTLTTTAT